MNHSIAKSECPSVEELAELIDGSEATDTGLVSHVDTCIACQTQLDRLTEPDRLKRYGEVARSKSREQPFLGPPIKDDDLGSFGDFAIESQIGAGGMGIVYRARDDRLGRIVALKVLTCVASPTALARFDRESHAASNLNHPNIVPIYSAGQSDDGRPYLVMPLIEGDSLKAAIQKTSMSFDEIATWTRQIADGLHTAHQAGLIHRDVKPANILLDKVDNQARLVDFGLVRGIDDQTLTRTEMMCGTPEYMSPEQANTETSDARSDVYALGITLYECLTGSVPFRGKPLDILAQHRDLEPIPPSRMNKSVPRDLETICLKAIQKEPGSRYLTAAEFASDLQSFLDGKPIQARPTSVLEKTWRWAKRNRPLAASLSLLFVALLTGTIVSTALWLRSEQNAALAKSRNESLLASQKVLTDNQINLWETLRNTYQRKATDVVGPYSQMPTAVRNTLLLEMVVTYRLLFERGRDDRDQLRKMTQELAEVTEFALERGMPKRSSQLTELNREIVDHLLKLNEGAGPEDLILAAGVYNQFAEARRRDKSQESETAWREAIRLAKLARERLSEDAQGLSAQWAAILVYDSRRGLLRLASKNNKSVAEKGLRTLADEVERANKSGEAKNLWLDLKQKVLLVQAGTVPGERAIEYRNQRNQVLQEMLESIKRDAEYDYWLHRTQAVNLVMLGVTRDSIGQKEEARKEWSEALSLLRQLIRDSPTNSQYRADSFETMILIANSDWNSNKQEEAIQHYQRAIEQFEITVQINPGDLQLARRAAQVRGMIGSRYLAMENHKEAAESFQNGANHIQAMQWEEFQMDVAERDQALLRDLLIKAADAFDSADMPQQSKETRQVLAAIQSKQEM